MRKAESLKELQRIPGVGPAVAGDLVSLGVTSGMTLNGSSGGTGRTNKYSNTCISLYI